MKLWKVLGLAGLAGVTATGVIIAREQRKRTHLTPEEIRARLQTRLEDAGAEPADGAAAPLTVEQTRRPGCLPLWRRSRAHTWSAG